MPLLVGWLIEAIIWVFKNRIGLFILQALVWLGITYGTQKVVITPTMNAIQGYMTSMSSSSGIGAAAFQWIGVLQFDIACTMLLSAYVTKLGVGAARIVLTKA
jgi:hypothetical protein